jgi:hypothetical protein
MLFAANNSQVTEITDLLFLKFVVTYIKSLNYYRRRRLNHEFSGRENPERWRRQARQCTEG